MTKSSYLLFIDDVARSHSSVTRYEDKLLTSWEIFEKRAEALSPSYDILRPTVPADFLNDVRAFVELLYQNNDSSAQADCDQIREKDAAYGGSWHARGGTGAFHALARKGDRLVSMMRKHGSLEQCRRDKTNSESIDDTIGDLRRYLILVLAWHVADGVRSSTNHEFARSTGRFPGPLDETCDVCGRDPRNSVHETLAPPPTVLEPMEDLCDSCGRNRADHITSSNGACPMFKFEPF